MFKLTSPAVKDGYLDVKYGINTPDQSTVVEGIPQVSFPFEWEGAPEGTVSYAVEYMDYDKTVSLYSQAKPQTDTEILLTLNELSARINGKEFSLTAPPVYIQESDDYLIPAKSVLSHIGGTLLWDETDGLGRADIKTGQTSVSLWAYDTNALINGGYYKLKTHPQITGDNVLLIPVSILSDVFGADVEFKESLSQLSIIY